MSDPTTADEFTSASGAKVWIPRAMVAAARDERRERGVDTTMRGQRTRNRREELEECSKNGVYEVGGHQYRFFVGDKMPTGARRIEETAPAMTASQKLQRRSSRIGAAAAKQRGKSGPQQQTPNANG